MTSSGDISWIDYWLEQAKEKLERYKKTREHLEKTAQYLNNQVEAIRALKIDPQLAQRHLEWLSKRIAMVKEEWEKVNANVEYFRTLVNSIDKVEVLHQLEQAKKAVLNLKLSLPKDWKPWGIEK